MTQQNQLYASLPMISDKFDVSAPEMSAKRIVPLIVPHARDPNVVGQTIEVVTGGNTNKIWKCSFIVRDGASLDKSSVPPVLIRVFGAEGMIDRDLETARFVTLWQGGVGPSYYGRFQNGRVEEFIEGCRTLEKEDLSRDDISLKIAVETARLHRAVDGSGQPELWDQMEAWLQQARGAKFEDGSAEAEQYGDIDLDWVAGELSRLKGRVRADSAVVFCHNDLLAGNIMVHEATGKVHLVDFEYGGFNYRGFDIANHFNEWAGGTEASNPAAATDYSLFPSPAQMRRFCSTYLEAMALTAERDLELLLEEVQVFLQINHFYWGLWGINMAATEGCAAFSYLNYTHNRLAEYRRRQKEGAPPAPVTPAVGASE